MDEYKYGVTYSVTGCNREDYRGNDTKGRIPLCTGVVMPERARLLPVYLHYYIVEITAE